MGKWPKTKVPTLIKCKKASKKKQKAQQIYKKNKSKTTNLNVEGYQKYSASQCNIETNSKKLLLKQYTKSTKNLKQKKKRKKVPKIFGIAMQYWDTMKSTKRQEKKYQYLKKSEKLKIF